MGKVKIPVELPLFISTLIEERGCVLFGSGAKYHLGLRLALPNDYDIIVPKSNWDGVIEYVKSLGYRFVQMTGSGNVHRFRNYNDGAVVRQLDLVCPETDKSDSIINILKRAQCHAQDNNIFCIGNFEMKRKLI